MEVSVEGPAWYCRLVRAWFEACRRKGRSPASIHTWGWVLRSFGRWVTAAGVEDVGALHKEHLRGWQATLAQRKPASQQVAVSSVRSFLRWTDREELGLSPGLWMWLDQVHVPAQLPLVLQSEELERILSHFERAHGRDLEAMRDRALFSFLVTSGARISEALSLLREDFQRGDMRVRLKGGREHLVVIPEKARQRVADYLRVRGRDELPELWIRIGRSGRVAMNPTRVNDRWRELCWQLGLSRITSRYMRGTAATEILEHGGTELDAANQLGHANLGSIHRYVDVRAKRRRSMIGRLDDLFPAPLVLPRRRRRRRRGVA